MHVRTHSPEEIAGAAKAAIFNRVEDAALDELLAVANAIDVFGDPIEGVQVAQAALAVLDVRLDQIAGLSGTAVALLAFRKLRHDKVRCGALDDLLVEARHQLVVKLLLAEQVARLEY